MDCDREIYNLKMSLGTLKIEVTEAHLKRDTDFFGKMDPFCFMRVREATWKSSVC